MALRMLSYVSLLYQDLRRTGELERTELLPLVLPMVLYREKRPWRAARQVADLMVPAPDSWSYSPSMSHLVLEEVRLDDESLAKMENLVAELFRIELSESLKASIPPLISFLKLAKKAGEEQDDLKRAVFTWYQRAQMPAKLWEDEEVAVNMAPEELQPMLTDKVEKWTNQIRNEGLAEGEAEGRAAVARNLLAAGLPLQRVVEMTELPEEKVRAIQEALAN